jgi:hypothetical protein
MMPQGRWNAKRERRDGDFKGSLLGRGRAGRLAGQAGIHGSVHTQPYRDARDAKGVELAGRSCMTEAQLVQALKR